MKISPLLRLALVVSLTIPWTLSGATIPGLFNTGVNSNLVLLAAGAVDPHYTLVQSADPVFPGPLTRVVNEGSPIPPWLANGPNSKWIAPQAPQGTGNQPGNYTYRTRFDLTGLEPATAVLTGRWSSDNAAVDILINGASTGITYDGTFSRLSDNWIISNGFIDGTNTLDFVINNAPGPGINPTGFRAELSGTADPTAPPGTPPTITLHPTNQTVGVADGARFSVEVYGSKPLSYQWRRNSNAILGATNATYTIGSATANDAGSYDVIVSNSSGTAMSTAATLTIVSLSPAQLTYEPLGPSSRRTGLAISEIMYHPTDRADGKNLEFIELYNSNPFPEKLGGYKISGDVDFTLPENITIAGQGFLVIAPAPADIESVYGITGVLGGFTNRFPNDAGTIRLRKRSDAILLELTYSDETPWPLAADGAGHSLVLARPSYGQANPRAWAASAFGGGSPGAADPVPTGALENVVINEILAHTDDATPDFIELYNHSVVPVDLSGCFLSDDVTTNRFRIPNGTTLGAGQFIAFDEAQLGFSLSANGDEVLLVNSNQTRVIDAIRFGGQANGVSVGRFPDGATTFHELVALTKGTANAPLLLRNVVINEIMYNPISGDRDEQFVELHNRGTNAADVSRWRFVDGITFAIPTNTVIPAGGFLVVARNTDRLRTNYPGLNSANLVGDFNGNLAGGGERLALAMPETNVQTNATNSVLTTNTFFVVVDEVTYGAGGRWGRWSDGGGSSLELIDAHSDNRLAANWADSDETAKGEWVNVEKTGTLDLAHTGNLAADQLQIILLGAGEALVDDVEVLPAGGANRISNPGFENGTTGWFFQGTHRLTSSETNGGYTGSRSLHLRASTRGDHVANRVRTPLTSSLAQGTMATIRAKVKWLSGHPEILFRLKGNHLEAVGELAMQSNLGTPGVPNSRARANAGPAIFEVTHNPALPFAGQVVRVEAEIADPDGVASVLLKYRIDPAATLFTVPMNDQGTNGDVVAGDGLFTGVIPGQSSGTLIAFRVEASDGFSPGTTTQFPAEAPVRECLVRVGESVPVGSFGTYRFWMTRANHDFWATREKMSNEGVDATFVYGTHRIVYNAAGHYSGSSYTAPIYTTPTGALCGYDLEFPDDDRVLGENHITLDWPIRDDTDQREQLMYWFLDQYGLPNMYRRYVNLFVNGVKRGAIYDDIQQPGGDAINQFFPNDNNGTLLKTDCWNEFDDAGNRIDPCILNSLDSYLTTGGVKKTARYRWNWRPRAIQNTANDFADLFALVDAVNTQGGGYQSAVEGLVDVEHWMRTFAMNDLASFWDAFGNPNAKNTYLYKPTDGTWKLFSWDFDVGLGVFNDPVNDALFPANVDSTIVRMYNFPGFVRAYWRALDEALNSFFQVGAGTSIDAILDSKYAAFQTSGISLNAPTGIKSWITQRRAFLLGQLNLVANVFTVAGTNNFATNRNFITLTGTAPVRAKTVSVNGVAYPITWVTVTSWRMLVPLAEGTNVLNVAAFDLNGGALSNASRTITVNYTGSAPSPRDVIVINEIMFNPLVPDAAYVEIFNTSTNHAFDLSHWRMNGLDYTFPPGTVLTNRQFIVLANDRAAFARAYGTAIPVRDVFSGNLQNNGETLTLIRPAASSNEVDLVVDRVRYESALPWSTNANGTGSALQLIDPLQENARVANWFSTYVPPVFGPAISTPSRTNDGWRFASATGSVGPGIGGGQMRLIMFLGAELGSAIVDDIALVPGTVPAVGTTNYVRNGDFELLPLLEDPVLTNSWFIGTNYTNSTIISGLTHAGSGALRMEASTLGSTYPRLIAQNLSPAPPANTTNTLSFWYWATNSSTNLSVRLFNSSAVGVMTNINISITPSNYVPPALISAATNSLSPGAANQLTTNLSVFPPLWINELQAENISGITDNAGQHDPWIEIYNASTNTVALDGLFLAPNYTNLTQWAFPAGASIGPTQFLVVFCDGQAAQSSGTEYHTSFRLPAASGAIALSYLYTNSPRVLDYVNYAGLHSDHSYGSFPDGQPFERQEFFHVTPRGTNDGRSAPLEVFINEWMASNVGALADPADADFDDWFELYNPTTNTVDLAGYFLTDTLTNQFKFAITTNMAHTIAPRGYLLVWADNETGQNVSAGMPRPDLHVNFQLARTGEVIGLFAADGTQIDAIVFANQTDDVSAGRFPDGTAGIYPMPGTTSPRAANRLSGAGNTPPVLDPIGNKTIAPGQTLTFTATGRDNDLPAQVLGFTLDAGAPAGANIVQNTGAFSWTPATPGNYSITVRVTDTGGPPASDSETITVTVLGDGSFTGSALRGTNFEMQWATQAGKKYAVDYTASLNGPIVLWTPLVTNTALGGSLTYTNATTNAMQRFFRVRVVE